jgi:SAM-dependent MidA family methyltransferase
MDLALYDADEGFFERGGSAGRAGGDFITSPEVGPLFGACVARALDSWWEQLGAPDPFLVVEAGAGNGRLCREVLRAEPRCLRALRYVLVERSTELRARQADLLPLASGAQVFGPGAPAAEGELPVPVEEAGPLLAALDELPARTFDGVVLANELLDNLPFDVVERCEDGWREVRVASDDRDALVEMLVPASDELAGWFEGVDAPVGVRLPAQRAVEAWLQSCSAMLHRGVVALIDYAGDAGALAARSPRWLRTYRRHGPGLPALETPGEQDITSDVLVDTLVRSATRAGLSVRSQRSQAQWLADLGIDELVEEGRRAWEQGAAEGGLAALAGRSRATETAALTDVGGLGAHTVVELAKGR